MIKNSPTILHAIDTTGPGGAETVFLDLVQHLQLDGYTNIAIIKGPGWVEDQLRARGIVYYIVTPSGGFSFKYYAALYKIIKAHNVKLIQAHLLGSTLTYSLLALLLRIPVVATLHGRVDVNPNEKLIVIKNRIMKWGVSRLVAVSNDLAAYIEGRGLFNKKNIRIIYNGIDTKKYGKNTLKLMREAVQIPDNAILVGSVGNVRPAKAYDVLIAAANIVIEKYPHVHFVVGGHQKADLMAKLDVLIDQFNIRSNIHFVGFQQNSAEFLGQMDLFALSSSSEGFSIATIEAMATGLPVVATKCGGPEEILAHNKTGYLVEHSNPEQLAAALVMLLNDAELCNRLAAAGKLHALQTFSMETLLSRYRYEFNEVLANRPSH